MSTLMDKLSLLMPPTHVGDARTGATLEIQHFLPDVVGVVTDVFMHTLGSDLPADQRELSSTLYVFGKLLTAEMERQLKAMAEVADRLAAANPSPSPILLEEPWKGNTTTS